MDIHPDFENERWDEPLASRAYAPEGG